MGTQSSGPFHSVHRPVSRVPTSTAFLKSGVTVLDADGKRLRGGQLWSIDGSTITIRTQAEAAVVRDYQVAANMLPADVAPVVGTPCVVEVVGATPDDFAVVTVRPAAPSDRWATEGTARRGCFSPGLVE